MSTLRGGSTLVSDVEAIEILLSEMVFRSL